MNKQNKKAFTLVELIVVITILAILGTIAFISLQGYSKSARDSRRISDVNNIKMSLELFILNTGKYPLPDNGEEVTYGSELLRTQGVVGDLVTRNLSKNLPGKPIDPLTETEYIFSVANTQKEFEVLTYYEGTQAYNNTLNIVNAASNYTPKINGTYNQVFIKTPTIIFPTPSIINAEVETGGMVLDGTNIKSQIITGGENFPDINNQTSTGNLNISLETAPVVTETSTDEQKIAAIEAIQTAYSGSDLANDSTYEYILSKTEEDDKLALVETVILNNNASVSTSSEDDDTLSGNDEYTKLLVHSDIDYSIFNTNDGFDGTEINTSKWNYTGDGNTSQNDKIIQSVASDVLEYSNLNSKFRFRGDFDIQIDFNNLSLPEETAGEIRLKLFDLDNNGFILRRYRDALNNLYQTYKSISAAWTLVGSNTNTSHTSGKFQIIRSGTTLTSYYWNGSDFVEDESVVISELGDININLDLLSSGNFPDISVERDNFQINSGTIIYDTFEDSSTNSKIITKYGNSYHSTTEKKFGNSSMYFNGNGDYLKVSDSNDWDYGSNDFTIDSWIYLDEPMGNTPRTAKVIYTDGGGVTTWDYLGGGVRSQLILSNLNYLVFAWSNEVDTPITLKSDNSIDIDYGWHHIAIVQNSSNLTMYLDGNKVGETNNITIPVLSSGSPQLCIGGYPDSALYSWNGYIDEFRISKGIARTEDENDFMYDPEGNGFTPPTSSY